MIGLCLFSLSDAPAHAQPSLSTGNTPVPVVVGPAGLLRDGKPYVVKGAGGDKHLGELARHGGNSARTWTTKGLDHVLDEAHSLGLTVSAGIWLEPECSWFSYSNPQHCDKQAERVRKEVLAHKNHPALLAWGIGNEVEGDGSNAAFWRQLGHLARLVKELDPHHPTFTALAGINQAKVEGLNQHAPALDYAGINTYGAVFGLRKTLDKLGWTRPWMLTEWGPRGFWEANKGPGGAPIEQTSSEKADMMARAYREVIRPGGACLGSYAFVWGWKFEASATWFGIFTHDGELTNAADALQLAWTGKPSANLAPVIGKLSGTPKQPVSAGTKFTAKVEASDPENSSLFWRWAVLPEPKTHNGHKSPPMPEPVEASVISSDGGSATIKAPTKPGIYRLHVWVKDGHGHAATANMPFVVSAG